MTTCTRKLEFDAGHRLLGHESLCAHNHGHRYVAEITCEAPLDSVGRVIDFSAIKAKVGAWIAEHWDHATIANENDLVYLAALEAMGEDRVYRLDGNPTAENIATELLLVARRLLAPIRVVKIRLWETPNCWVDVE